MGEVGPRPLGVQFDFGGIQVGIHEQTSSKESVQGYTGSLRSRTKVGSGGRDRGAFEERGHPSGERAGEQASFPLVLLSDTKEAGQVETDLKPKAIQQELLKTAQVQNGDSGVHPPVPCLRNVGDIAGYSGRLSSHPNAPGVHEVPGFPLPEGGLRLHLSTIRPVHSSSSLHQSFKDSCGLLEKEGDSSLRLSRRLAHSERLRGSITTGHKRSGFPPRRPRLGNQRREVLPSAFSEDHLPRGGHRLGLRQSFPFRQKGSGPELSSRFFPTTRILSGSCLVTTPRDDGEPHRDSSTMQTPHASGPISCPSSLPPVFGRLVRPDPSRPFGLASPQMVDKSTQSASGEIAPGPEGPDIDNNRRFSNGLGSDSRSGHSCWDLDPFRGHAAHKQSGARGYCQSGLPLVSSLGESCRHRLLGQHDCSSLYQPARRNEVASALQAYGESPPEMLGLEHHLDRIVPGGKGQCDGGCPFQRKVQQWGLDHQSGLGEAPFSDLRVPERGPVCRRGQLSSPDLLLQTVSPPSLEDRRVLLPLGQPLPVRLPSMEPGPKGSDEVPVFIECGDDPSSSLLAESSLVSVAATAPVGPSAETPLQPIPTNSAEGSSMVQGHRKSSSFSMEVIRERLRQAGISEEASSVACGSRRESTIRTYDSRLDRFTAWAADNSCDPVEATVVQVVNFLTTIFREGKQTGTVRNYRSAIAAIHRGFDDGSTVGNNQIIAQLLRGMFQQRPRVKRLPPSWSINEVLFALSAPPYEPIQNATLELLTFKTLFLIAAASARRRGCLHSLTTKPGFIRFDPTGVRLLPDPLFLAKNQSMSFSPGEIFLPSLKGASSIAEDRFCCPVRALKWYLEKTKAVRTSERLFIIPRSPYTPAAKDTISKWISNLIKPFATKDEVVRAHDIRGHSTSKAWFSRVPLEDIMRAAAWQTPSSFVSHYLTDTVSSEGAFARSVLRVPVREAPVRPPQ